MPGDITAALLNWDRDRNGAIDQIVPFVYEELHKMAGGLMRRERDHHTIQPTALLNEVYLRLVRQDAVSWKDRAHFFGVAARIMRQILVDYARRRTSLKRGGDARPTQEDIAATPSNLEVLMDLEDALTKMQDWDQRKLQVIELHYYGGLKAEEIAEALGLSLPTVRRDLIVGRVWLREQFTS